MQILSHAAYLQRSRRAARQSIGRVVNIGIVSNFLVSAVRSAPARAPHSRSRGIKCSLCGFSALEDECSRLYALTVVMRGREFNEKTRCSNRRGAFTPEYRWLHQHAPAADGDEGLNR
jgi:hypothetical protein